MAGSTPANVRTRLADRSRSAVKRLGAAAMATGCLFAIGAAPTAAADNSWPPTQCGTDADGGYIWNRMKNALPTTVPDAMGDRIVVWPHDDQTQGYAVHNGSSGNEHPWNLLLVPTVRVNGIECPNLTASNTPQFFKDAASHVDQLPDGNADWALTINSRFARGENQLHIHMSKLFGDVRNEFNGQATKAATDPSKWYDSVISVKEFKYRAWNAPSLDYNLFAMLFDNVVKKSGPHTGMENETLLVTRNLKGTGFLVMSSDKSGLMFGTDNSDWALDRNA
jgi:CDP-diacylglycerol pyrophosphatase